MSAVPTIVTMPERLRAQSAIASPHQRTYARTLMQQLDLDARFIGLAHARFFLAAGLVRPRDGESVDAALSALSKTQISALIGALTKEVPRE